MAGAASDNQFGVYVHIPFCAARCDYCDFATWTDRGHLIDTYVDACVADLEARRTEGHPPATSVFFGGGTPSLIAADQLVRMLYAIDRAPATEVTVASTSISSTARRARASTTGARRSRARSRSTSST